MIFLVSRSFLRRLCLLWKPDLQAFLVGERNLNFFIPDFAIECGGFTAHELDEFLQRNDSLIGFLSGSELPAFPGYVRIQTGRQLDPSRWKGSIIVLEGTETRECIVEIKVAADALESI